MASALDEAHANGIVHRDVKPANIMVGRAQAGHGEEVYLTDFGIVRDLTQHTRLTDTGTFVGTLDYAAPEVFQGVQIDGRADQYSLACVLYRCLTGDVPFPADSEAAVIAAHLMQPPPAPSAREPSMPAALDPVLERALAKSPDQRFGTCAEFVQRCREALGQAGAPADRAAVPVRERTLAAPPPPPPTPLSPPAPAPDAPAARTAPPSPPPPGSRRRRIALIAAVVAVLAVVAVIVVIASGGSSKHPVAARTSTAGGGSPTATSSTPAPTSTVSTPASAPPTSGGPTGSPVAPGPKPVVEQTFKIGDLPFGVVRDATAVWVTNQGSGTISEIDPGTRRVIATRTGVPNAFEIASGLGSLWVTDQKQTLFRLDPAGGPPQRFRIKGGAFGVAVGFGSVWVTNDQSDTVTRLDASGNVVTRIPTGHLPHGITAGNDSVWVAGDTGSVTRIDPTTNARTATIGVPTGSAFQVVEDSGSVWVTNGITAVIRIDPDTNKVVETISTKGGSFDVAGGFGSIWVTNAGSNTLSRIDVVRGKVTNVLRVGVSPRLLAVGPEGLWVVNGDSRSVSLIHP